MSDEGNCQRCRKGAPCDEHRESYASPEPRFSDEQINALLYAQDPSLMEDREEV